jgi:hypothetical protein
LPGDGIAGHAPYILFHTVLTDTETTPAPPAEGKLPAAAVANMVALLTVFSSIGRSCFRVFHGCCFIALLICTLKNLIPAAKHVNPDKRGSAVRTLRFQVSVFRLQQFKNFKYQITNTKQITMTEIQNLTLFRSLNMGI